LVDDIDELADKVYKVMCDGPGCTLGQALRRIARMRRSI
jgi:hypothetical protein